MERLTELLRNLRVRTKFLLILLLATALVSAAALGAVHIPMKAYDDRLYQSSAQTIALFAEQIQSELQDFEAISYRILADNTLQKNLSIMKSTSPGTVAWVSAQTEVANRVAYFGLWFSNTVSFRLKTEGGRSYGQFFRSAVNDDELTTDRIELAESLDGRLTWVVADGQEPQLFLLRGIREMQGPTLDTLATMLIEVDFPALVEQYRGAMTRLGSPLQCAIYRDGVCLYASNEAVSALQPGANGYTRMKLDGQDMLCVRYTGTDGMQYVTLVDYGSISRRVFAAVCITALVILAATVLAMVVSGWQIGRAHV